MSDHAAIGGVFSDFKLVKTRSAAQIVVEVPIEEADRALAALGGLPQAGQERPVAVARMAVSGQQKAEPEEQPQQRRSFHELPYSQQAAMKCNEVVFRRFLAETGGWKGEAVLDADMAAAVIREQCSVSSRSELDTNEEAAAHWRDLYSKFKAWEQVG